MDDAPKPYTLEEWRAASVMRGSSRVLSTIEALFARVAELEAERDALLEVVDQPPGDYTPYVELAVELSAAKRRLPCGHPAACVESSDEGTSFCRWCEDVGRLTEQARLRDIDFWKSEAEGNELAEEALRIRQERDEARANLARIERALPEQAATVEAWETLKRERDAFQNTIGRLVSALECVWMEIEEGEVRDLKTVMFRAKDAVRRIKDEERIR